MQLDRFPPNPDARCSPGLVDSKCKRYLESGRAFDGEVLGSFERAPEGLAVPYECAPAAILDVFMNRPRSELGETPLSAEQVGRAHRGEQPAVELLRRKADWNAQHR